MGALAEPLLEAGGSLRNGVRRGDAALIEAEFGGALAQGVDEGCA